MYHKVENCCKFCLVATPKDLQTDYEGETKLTATFGEKYISALLAQLTDLQ